MNRVLAYYHSPAAGKAQYLYDYGVKYGLDSAYALAFFMHESSFGTTGVARTTKSLSNMRCVPEYPCLNENGGYAFFSTWEQSYEAGRMRVGEAAEGFDALKKAHAWIPIDGTYDLGPGPRVAPDTQQLAYLFSRCMTCGCCLEACPQVNSHSDFMGAAVIGQVYLMSQHPTGKMNHDERLEAMMGNGGIADCGNAQNCIKACPKEIPLVTSIAEVNKQITKNIFKLLGK